MFTSDPDTTSSPFTFMQQFGAYWEERYSWIKYQLTDLFTRLYDYLEVTSFEHCPAGAISMVRKNPDDPKSLMIPTVNEERCIGCGACENLCPARPFTAIHVEGHEVHKTI